MTHSKTSDLKKNKNFQKQISNLRHKSSKKWNLKNKIWENKNLTHNSSKNKNL